MIKVNFAFSALRTRDLLRLESLIGSEKSSKKVMTINASKKKLKLCKRRKLKTPLFKRIKSEPMR